MLRLNYPCLVRLLQPLRRSGSCALLLMLVALPLAAQVDRLERPALPSALAERALLLDLASANGLLVAVGERGHILRSVDDGLSWQQARVPVSVTLTAVTFVDSEYGWAVGHDGVILASRDGGASWSVQLDGRSLNAQLVSYFEALQAASDDGTDASLDPDLVAQGLDDALFAQEEGPSKPFLDLYFADRQHGWVVGAYGLLLRTDDGGASWQPLSMALDNPDNFHLNAIAAQGDQLFIAGEAGSLYRSDDRGASWLRLDPGYGGPLFSVTLTGENEVLLSGLRGRLFVSGDAGESWRLIETATRATFNAARVLAGGSLLAVGNGGTVLYAPPGGESPELWNQPGRQSYTALSETASGALVLVGQYGVTRATLDALREVGDE